MVFTQRVGERVSATSVRGPDLVDWKALTKGEQEALFVPDEILRKRGDLVSAVQPTAMTARLGWHAGHD